ncbi:MAG: acyl-ACP--UDP-N-acetylglucosamine O-acyltransferase [Candidatus Omnitrophica bacterium]|nr:acyl-ACP--UDP-N-acetylglucosamine O-acyltransferase [Candidatus Omnitrophota bacterium]
MAIHPTAIIDPKADIASDVEIGPYVIIEPSVRIGRGVKIAAHTCICRNTSIGDGTVIHAGAVLGDTPQDLAFKDEDTYLEIGKNNIIREYVTIHRGTKAGTKTVVGDNNFLMATCHLGHNCAIGNNVIIANGALLAGYVTVEDGAFISGNVVIHQFCRIGRISIIGGFSGVNKDVPPYMSVRGPSVVWSINLVGLRRARFSRDIIYRIKEAYTLVYKTKYNTREALEKILASNPGPEVMHFVDFIRNSKRGICLYRFEGEDRQYFEGSKEETGEVG